MVRKQVVIRLHTDEDVRRVSWLDYLDNLLTMDDNGAPPDGTAWLLWDTDGSAPTDEDIALLNEQGIKYDLLTGWVTEYETSAEEWARAAFPPIAAWCGHQTRAQACFTDIYDAQRWASIDRED